ncbi:MAG: von Willebrand factor type A domain-containing protein [Candidatus Omnitrophica bacterium]|nr:von Willebrand factor type A domain-containing protein [Candidatus Omnitrophota bacterium]
MRDHEQIKQLISVYFDGAATPEEERIVLAHLKDCESCRKYWQEVKSISSSLKELPQEDLSPDLEQKINKKIRAVQDREEQKMKKKSYVGLGVGAGVVSFIVCLLVIQTHVKTGIQGKWRMAADDIGTEYAAARQQIELAKQNLQYETYYLEANYGQKGEMKAQPLPAPGEHQGYVDRRMKEIYARAGVDKKSATHGPRTLKKDSEPQSFMQIFGAGEKLEDGRSGSKSALYAYNAKGHRTRSAGGYQVEKGASYDVLHDDFSTAPAIEPSKRPVDRLKLREISVSEEIWPLPPRRREGDFNTEAYDRIYENGFKVVLDNPLSTFSIDVDTASYSNVRRFLNQGQLPPEDAVRIEEMVNYFVYDYPQPRGRDPFSINTEIAACPWNQNHQLALIGLQGKQLAANEIAPSNLVFLIDVSGSMNDRNKLPLLKSAFRMFVNQLHANERVSIVTYAGSAGLVLDSTRGANKGAIFSAIDRLHAGGSTAGGQGIQLAYDVAQRNFIPNGNNRVILATDGDFNVGMSSDADMVRLIEEKRNAGIFLSVLGFGTGNYKDAKMEKIADKGNGNYYYIDSENEARKVLVHELGSLLFTIAKDVKLQIEFNPSQVKAYRLIGYENRVMAKEDFNNDTKDAGELGAGHTVTALYEIVPAGSPEQYGDIDALKYQKQVVRRSNDFMTVKLRYKQPKGHRSQLISETIDRRDIRTRNVSENFNFATSVAEFGLLLRDSQFKGNANYDNVLNRARYSRGRDSWGYRTEFINLVEKAKSLQIPQYYNKPYYKGRDDNYIPRTHPMFKGHRE